MSWILIHRKKLVTISFFLIVISFAIFLRQMTILILVSIMFMGFILNKIAIKKYYKPLTRLSPSRPVETIDTLIIGDYCTKNQMKSFCNLEHALMVVAPRRSLFSSFLILKHLTSRLQIGANIIIIDRGSIKETTYYDYPYLSQIEKLKISHPRRWLYCFFLYRLLYDIGRGNCLKGLCATPCPNTEIQELCTRKGFTLIYLHTT